MGHTYPDKDIHLINIRDTGAAVPMGHTHPDKDIHVINIHDYWSCCSDVPHIS